MLTDMNSVKTKTLVNIFVSLSHHKNLSEVEEKIKQKHKIPAYMYLKKVQTEFDCLMIG